MKSVIIIAIAFVLLIPISIFAQEEPLDEIDTQLDEYGIEGIAIWISIASLGISGIVLLSYLLSRRNFKSEAMLSLFKIIGNIDVKKSKKILFDEYWRCKGNNENPDFKKFQDETFRVAEAYNQSCALYELNLIDKKHFREVYGGNIVRTFNLMDKHIVSWLPNNKEYCKHFKDVVKELTEEHNITGELYRDVNDSSKSKP